MEHGGLRHADVLGQLGQSGGAFREPAKQSHPLVVTQSLVNGEQGRRRCLRVHDQVLLGHRITDQKSILVVGDQGPWPQGHTRYEYDSTDALGNVVCDPVGDRLDEIFDRGRTVDL